MTTIEEVNTAWLEVAKTKQSLDRLLNARIISVNAMNSLYDYRHQLLRVYMIADPDERDKKMQLLEFVAKEYGLTDTSELFKEVYNQLERDKLVKEARAQYDKADKTYTRVLYKLGR